MENKVTFRNAERKDTGLILQFVKELAAYEDMSDDVIADESILETWIFDKQKAEVLFAVVDGTEVGFALFFHNFFYLSWTGRPLFGGLVCNAGISWKRIRKSTFEKTGIHCSGTWLRTF